MTIKVGDEIRYTGQSMYDLTQDEIYAIRSVCKGQDACDLGFVVLDDVGDANSIISESYEPVGDTPALPPIWNDMTDAEKGALLLADYEGKVIEYYDSHLSSWLVDHGFDPQQNPDVRYRVAEPAPVLETVKLIGGYEHGWGFYSELEAPNETHLITFNTIDGAVDLDSIKMEEL